MNAGMPMGTESDWEAESDARTLADADAIRADAARMNKAQAAAARLLKKKEEEMKSLALLANAKLIYPNSPDMGGKKK